MTISWFLYRAFYERNHALQTIFNSFSVAKENLFYLILCLLLTPLNWGLEAKKWQLLARPFEHINFPDAYTAVLSGVALGFVGQQNMGDALGRISSLSENNRWKGIAANILGGSLQFYVALVVGAWGYCYFYILFHEQLTSIHTLLGGLLLLSCFLGVFMILNIRLVSNKFRRMLSVLDYYSLPMLHKILLIGLGRYGVFVIQFLLVLLAFQIKLPVLSMISVVGLVYLCKSVIPSFSFLSDLGVREFSAVYFFTFYRILPEIVVSATLTLWFINLFIPAILGSFGLLKLKFERFNS